MRSYYCLILYFNGKQSFRNTPCLLAQVLGNRSAAYGALGRHEEALTDAINAISIDPSYVKGYYRQTSALIELKRYEEAIAAAQAGLALNPSNTGLIKLRDRAAKAFEASKADTPMDIEADDDEETDAVEPELPSESEEVGPSTEPEVSAAERAEAAKEAGNMQYKAGFYERAISLYGEAISLVPNSATYYLNRSAALLALSKWSQALEDAQRSMELDPTNLKVRVALA